MLSPGFFLLSIYKDKRLDTDCFENADSKYFLFVDPIIKNNENGITILLGIFSINSGAKGLVRWTQGVPTFPMFGFDTSTVPAIIITVLLGFLSIIIGCGFLKLNKKALYGTILSMVLTCVGFSMSSKQFPSAVEKMVIHRREVMQGGQARQEEIESMKKNLPQYILVGGIVYIGALFVIRKRLVN